LHGRDVLPACSKQSPRLFTGERLSLRARPAESRSHRIRVHPPGVGNDLAGQLTGPGGRTNRGRHDAASNEWRAGQLPGRHRSRQAELIDSYDPIVRGDWQARAACRGMGCDLLFPTSGNALGLATRICGRCPVLEECRTTALDDPSLYGVWARTSVAASSSAK
jgi:WhiB family redox-sensing transcriptional regulator